jgi:fumarate hydratase class I
MNEEPAQPTDGGAASAGADDFAYSPLLPTEGEGPRMRGLDIGGVETTTAEVGWDDALRSSRWRRRP